MTPGLSAGGGKLYNSPPSAGLFSRRDRGLPGEEGDPVKVIPTVLCGGTGSRLWPVSRELHPKPFIRLADGQSLLQKAFLRGAALPGVVEILTVTNGELSFKTEDEFKEVNRAHLPTSFILEPF